MPITEFVEYLDETVKWELQKRGLWEDPKIKEEKEKHLKDNRLTAEKLEQMKRFRNG